MAGNRLKKLQSDQSGRSSIPSDETTSSALNDFEACVRRGGDDRGCLDRLKSDIRKNPKDELAAARLVRRSFNSSVALPFYEPLVARNSPSICLDEDLSLAVIAGLGLPGDYSETAIARSIFADRCYANLEAVVIKALAGENGPSFLKESACPILMKNSRSPASCQPGQEAKPVVNAPETLPKITKSQIRLEPGKAYRGSEGETVTVLPIQGGDLYLIHFAGVSGSWNGKTILHRREDRGHGAATFWTEYEGSRRNSIVQRSGVEVFVPGYKPGSGFAVSYSEQASKDINSTTVLDTYQP